MNPLFSVGQIVEILSIYDKDFTEFVKITDINKRGDTYMYDYVFIDGTGDGSAEEVFFVKPQLRVD